MCVYVCVCLICLNSFPYVGKPFQLQTAKRKNKDLQYFTVISETTQLAQAVDDYFVS